MPDSTLLVVDLMRHGEVDGPECFRGSTDDPLSKKGWRQMEQALNIKAPWTQLISSPLRRCAEFSRQLSSNNEVALAVEQDLQEIHFGAWEGRTAEEIHKNDPETLGAFFRDPANHTPPEAEALGEFKQRVLNIWEQIISRQKSSRHILVVSHGGPIRIIIAHILGIPENKLLSLEVPLASISRINIRYDQEYTPFSSVLFHGRQA